MPEVTQVQELAKIPKSTSDISGIFLGSTVHTHKTIFTVRLSATDRKRVAEAAARRGISQQDFAEAALVEAARNVKRGRSPTDPWDRWVQPVLDRARHGAPGYGAAGESAALHLKKLLNCAHKPAEARQRFVELVHNVRDLTEGTGRKDLTRWWKRRLAEQFKAIPARRRNQFLDAFWATIKSTKVFCE